MSNQQKKTPFMRSPITLKNHHQEQRIVAFRLLWATIAVVLCSTLLVGRLFWLQSIEHEKYTTLSNKNRVQTIAIAPPRGLIYDRKGRLLAENQADFSLSVVPEQAEDLLSLLHEIDQWVELQDSDIERFHRRLNSPRRPWEPVPLKSRLNEEQVAQIAARQHVLQGVRIDATPTRHYPYSELFAHVLGYVNRINTTDLENMTAEEKSNYSGTHFHGRTGVERFYERYLHGQAGYQKVETNARGRILRVLQEEPPLPGSDLHLHLDLDIQQAAWDALEDRRGAIVAIDPRNGGVIAFVSRPAYDPNLFVTGISHADYARYRDDRDQPLFNRALQGQYAPGSTIKPMAGLAGLDAGVTNWSRTIWDPGYYRLEGEKRVFRDWLRGGHGHVDMRRAVVESCDTYFYDMTFTLGINKYHEFMDQFGLGKQTGIDLPGEYRGILPSREWKRATLNQAWYHGDTVNASIGQGYMLATPLQLSAATAILARKGQQMVPRVAQFFTPPTVPNIELKDSKDWDYMHEAMAAVVTDARGTARRIRTPEYNIAAKTGTSQVFSLSNEEEYNAQEIEERLRDHALFIGFAPLENPAIAVVALVENGGGGGSTAAPIARQVMDAWLLNEEGELDPPSAIITHEPFITAN
ncbi:MAG TPA: penicillin-binding protein 2 [Alcanivoracaceae bacterium]|nr:penicillin-binding protein 2 [Alcanivoracaceae bacterium]